MRISILTLAGVAALSSVFTLGMSAAYAEDAATTTPSTPSIAVGEPSPNAPDTAARKEYREEMQHLKADHEALKAEREKLKAECKDQAETADCKTKREELVAKKKALHERATALREKAGMKPGEKMKDFKQEHGMKKKHGLSPAPTTTEGGSVGGVVPSAQ